MKEKRVKISTILDNQFPSFIKDEYPLIVDFFKSYYNSIEYFGGAADILTNIDNYTNVEVLVSDTSGMKLQGSITSTDTVIKTINVNVAKQLPDTYGLLKIDDEIITYTNKVTTETEVQFRGCIRGFSGIEGYQNNEYGEDVIFNKTIARRHNKNSDIIDVGSVFLSKFLDKIKYQIAPGFENVNFAGELNEETFLKQIRSFYSSKGTDESFKILFRALYGQNVEVISQEENLVKPSNASYKKVDSIVVSAIEGNPIDLQFRTIFQNNPSIAYAPIAYVEKLYTGDTTNSRENDYYRLDIDSGYDRDPKYKGSIYGVFSTTPKTKVVSKVAIGSSSIVVDSTLGFGATGNLSVRYNDGTSGILYYSSKNLNQFEGIESIQKEILDGQVIRDNDIFVYSDVDGKQIKCNISNIIVDADIPSESHYLSKKSSSTFKTLGYEDGDFVSNDWFFNNRPNYSISEINTLDSTNNSYTIDLNNFHYLKKTDPIELIISDTKSIEGRIESVISNYTVVVQIAENIPENNLQFAKNYSLKKLISKATSIIHSEVSDLLPNIQNVYRNKVNNNILVASSSLPTESISANIVSYDITGNTSGEIIRFTENHSLYSGDYVYYRPETITNTTIQEGIVVTTTEIDTDTALITDQTQSTSYLSRGNYYVHRVSSNEIKLALSKENIFANKFISVYGTNAKGKITLEKFNDKKIENQKLLKEIAKPKNTTKKVVTAPGATGILVNGVEILNYKSDEIIYFGELKDISVVDSTSNLDISNPPDLIIEDNSSYENRVDASGYITLSGELNSIKIVDKGHDYVIDPVITIKGGNGTGAQVSPNMQLYTYKEEFKANSIKLGENKIIFSEDTKFRNYEEVFYDSRSQPAISGITTNASYYINIGANPKEITLHDSFNDALSGINTVDLSSYSSGIHYITAKNKKKRLESINIINPGSGYSNNKVVIDAANFDPSTANITSKNHGYSSREIIKYIGITTNTDTEIPGLVSGNEYYVTKVDDDTFKLSNIATDTTVEKDFFYNRSLYIPFSVGGVGKQVFNYPEIEVTLSGKTYFGDNYLAQIQPHFRGSITSAKIIDGGTKYGSNVINLERKPFIYLSKGDGFQGKVIINNGSIVEVIILDGGRDYKSAPDIVVNGPGFGAVLTSIVQDGRVVDVKIINGGLNHLQSATSISAVSPESVGTSKFDSKLQSWRINLVQKYFDHFEKDDGYLNGDARFGIQYTHLYAPRYLRKNLPSIKPNGEKAFGSSDLPFKDSREVTSTNHSPIIGWAYDGNPIYGPYGFDGKAGNGSITQMLSGYSLRKNLYTNPNRLSISEYPLGIFIEDFVYTNVTSENVLDENNGRFCFTPEFPNGTYAYFSTLTVSNNVDGTGPFVDYKKPIFPYLIGQNYNSQPYNFNFDSSNNQITFDVNESDYLRNTRVYNLIDKNLRYDYISTPVYLNQSFKINQLKKGGISNVNVVSPGENYKVGDIITFTQEESALNSPALAKVSTLRGKTSIGVTCDTSNLNVDIYPTQNKDEYIAISTLPNNYNYGDLISISGISTYTFEFTGNYKVKLDNLNYSLKRSIDNSTNTGISTYIFLSNGNVKDLKSNDILQIGEEKLKVLDIDTISSRVKVLREFSGTLSSSHDSGSNVVVLPTKFTFDSQNISSFDKEISAINKEIYFDPNESLGISTNTDTFVAFSNPGYGITSVYVPPKAIYLKDHNLSNGDIVTYKKNDLTPTDDIYYNDNTTVTYSGVGTFLPDGQELYVTKFDNNFIGLSTVKVAISTNGQYLGITTDTDTIGLLEWVGVGTDVSINFPTITDPLSNSFNSFVTNYKTYRGISTKNEVKVTTQTPHEIDTNHRVTFSLNPTTTKNIKVRYSDTYKKILINQRSFVYEDVDSDNMKITIEDHQFSNGQKLIFNTEDNTSAVSDDTIVYALVLDEDTIQLTDNLSYTSSPNIIGVSSVAATLSPINPEVISYSDDIIDIDMSDETLQYSYRNLQYPGFKIEFFTDSQRSVRFEKTEGSSRFNIQTTGEVGKDAVVSLTVTDDFPKELFYRIVPVETSGVPLPVDFKAIEIDTEVESGGKITIKESLYSGSYQTRSISSNEFSFIVKEVPEKVSYATTEASISYVTDCTHATGGIDSIEITNTGSYYESLPEVNSVITENGQNALFEVTSDEIGSIVSIDDIDYGYNFPFDKTLSAEVYYPQVLSITPFTIIEDVKIESLGFGFPDKEIELALVDPVTKTVGDTIITYNPTNFTVNIIRNTKGISDAIPFLYPIESGAGVRVSNIEFDTTTKDVTVTLDYEYSLGDYYPFEIGDEVMIEGVVKLDDSLVGFNSKEFNYQLFTITDLDPNFGAGQGTVTFNISDNLTQLEISASKISEFDTINSRARIIPKKHFPKFSIETTKGNFVVNERVYSGNKIGFVDSWNEKNILVVRSSDIFQIGDIVSSDSTKSRGEVNKSLSEFISNSIYGSVASRTVGWEDLSGFLNNVTQKIPDNDYYQKFSYSLKSPVQYSEWNDTVSSLNHVAGYKKFSDYQLESYEVDSGNAPRGNMTPKSETSDVALIKETVSFIDLNCINDFDLCTENGIDLSGDLASTEIIFGSKYIKNFQESIFNRAVNIDDISGQFNHRPRPEEYVDFNTFKLSRTRALKYIALLRDTRFTSERQIVVFDVLHDSEFGYINEYARLSTVNTIGTFDFVVEKGLGNIRFFPEAEKVNFNDYSITFFSYKLDDNFVSAGQTAIGDNVLFAGFSTQFNDSQIGIAQTIVSLGSTYHALSAMVCINPDENIDNIEFASSNINFIHDDTDVYTGGEYGTLFTDLTNTSELVGYGTFGANLNGGYVNIEFTPNSGIGTTCAINMVITALSDSISGVTSVASLDHVRNSTRKTTIPQSPTPSPVVVSYYDWVEFNEEFHGSRHIAYVTDTTNNIHQITEMISIDTLNAIGVIGVTTDTFMIEYNTIYTSSDPNTTIGTFESRINPNGFTVELVFTPNPNIDTTVNILSQDMRSDPTDLVGRSYDLTNAIIETDRELYRGTYNVIERNFELKHNGQPIFEYYFDGSSEEIVNLDANTINIPNHFFITGEKIKYNKFNTNDPLGAISIASTSFAGTGTTTILPEDIENIYIVKIDDDTVKLASSAENALSPNPPTIEFTNVGIGNSHRFATTNQNAKVLVTIDNIIQKPIVPTSIQTQLTTNVLTIDDIIEVDNTFSIFGGDILRINEELMRVDSIGIGSEPNKLRVSRARLGSVFNFHLAGSTVTKIIGNYNIVENTISFADAPYGKEPVANPSDPNETDWTGIATGSYFYGRSFMKGPIFLNTDDTYSKNYVFDDISQLFTGQRKEFPLTVDGNDIDGFAQQNATILINNVFQIPGDDPEINAQSYFLREPTPTSTELVFNGDPADVITGDPGTTPFPIRGILQSVASTEGFGYQPRIPAGGVSVLSSVDTVESVSVATTGSGYRAQEFIEILTTTIQEVGIGDTVIHINNRNGLYDKLNLLVDTSNCNISIGTYITPSEILDFQYSSVNIGVADTSEYLIPIGTQVKILIENPSTGIVNVSAATSYINQSVPAGILYDVTNASYTPSTGMLVMTLPETHEIVENSFIKLNDNSLYFTCSSDGNNTVKSYPRPGYDNISYNNKLRVEEVNGSDIRVYVGTTSTTTYDVSDATYDHTTGLLEMTIGSHNFIAGRGISLETNSLTFTCAQDNHGSTHIYPRPTDPAADTTLDISAVTSTTITVDVGTNPATVSAGIHTFVSATSGAVVAGGDYTHTFVGVGTAAVLTTTQDEFNPVGFVTVITGTGKISENVTITDQIYIGDREVDLVFDAPVPYSNIPLIYSNDSNPGVGSFASININVGSGSSVIEYDIINAGLGFNPTDILTIETGGLTGIPTTSNFSEFQLIVDTIESDDFGGWSMGDLLLLDDINEFIDGERKIFPLRYFGESISIIAGRGSKIEPKHLLLVFVNNILQVPDISFTFDGGSRITFTEALRLEDRIQILFYRGNGEIDLNSIEIIETIKIGDTVRINSNEIKNDQDPRFTNDITSTDTIETLPYYGPGNVDAIELKRSIDFCRQTEDIIMDGLLISKAREFYEPIISPFTQITKNVGVGSTAIYVSSLKPIFTQFNENEFNLKFQNEIKFIPVEEKRQATATATVSIAGTISEITITDGGFGYESAPLVSIASTNGLGIRTDNYNLATAEATVTNGVVDSIGITSIGVGYTSTNPPTVYISPPSYVTETVSVSDDAPLGFNGDFGTIVGFATTSIIGDTYMIFDLKISDIFLQEDITDTNTGIRYSKITGVTTTMSSLAQNDVFTVRNTNIGSANTTITSYDKSGVDVIGISTTFIDGVFEVYDSEDVQLSISGVTTDAKRVIVRADNVPLGYDYTANAGMTTSTYFGDYDWGRIDVIKRSADRSYNAYTQNGYTGISTSTNIVRVVRLRDRNYF